jgi:glycosyltransferase involved in cell wall biosynthesis
MNGELIKDMVSVIIPTANSARTISSCLSSLKHQTYQKLETIVVDRYSSDTTVLLAEKYANLLLRSNANRSRARNLGAKVSSGEYLFFVDSDMEVEKNVIEYCVRCCKLQGFDAVIIPETSVGEGYWSNCIALEKLLYLKNPLIEAARFFTRRCFFDVGGYDEDLEVGEDWDLHLRVLKHG